MRVVQILPGSGSRFYCENCARDTSLARGLTARGHEVITGSMYLPLPADTESAEAGSGDSAGTAEPAYGEADRREAAAPQVFYGAVNLYLRHRFPSLRGAPHWVERLFDSQALLRLAGRLSGATDAAGLEELTLSMLRGEEGGQAGELDRLVRWLAEVRPEVVHLSNCLLSGIARRVRRELGIPVVCSLQDEDTWLNGMAAPARESAWATLRDRAQDVELFLPVSAWYARFMGERLGVPPERLRVVPIGIEVPPGARPPSPPPAPAVGYLARICRPMGAGLLAEAFCRIAGRFPTASLRLTGGSTGADAGFRRSLRRQLAAAGVLDRVHFERSFAPGARARFLAGVSLLCVPVLEGEAFGTFILDALAAGVPVVQPRLGGFPELVEATGGGLLYEPNTPEALAAAIGELLGDPERSARLGREGQQAVQARYTSAHMAAALETACLQAVEMARR